MDYTTSSHQLRWQYDSSSQLNALRQEANSRSVSQARAALSEYAPTAAASYAPLGVHEERLLQRFFMGQLCRLCTALRIPSKVKGSALGYFSRFFLNCSTMDAEPKHIMMAAVYVACKIEEFYISAEDLGKMAQQDSSIVLREELTLLRGLNFDLIVHHPFRALFALQFIFEDIAGFGEGEVGAIMAETATVTAILAKAKSIVDALLLTDAPLLKPPGLLAVCSARVALCEHLGKEKGSAVFAAIVPLLQKELGRLGLGNTGNVGNITLDYLIRATDELGDFVAEGRAGADQEEVRLIDRKAKLCRNPAVNKDSEYYKKVHAKREKELEARRAEKQVAKRQAHEAAMAVLVNDTMPLPPPKRRKTVTP